jgi:hypothetical protein
MDVVWTDSEEESAGGGAMEQPVADNGVEEHATAGAAAGGVAGACARRDAD